MNGALTITEKDELIMKLVHYFVTKEDYAPILVNGVKNEIWLENLEAEYKIVRINSNYIHNNEQLQTDNYKIIRVNGQIKKKTLTRKLKTLNILTDVGSNVTDIPKNDLVENIIINSNEDLIDKNGISSLFPLIKEENKSEYLGKGLDFLLNVSNDINKKTETQNKFYEDVFKKKKIIATKVLIITNILLYLFCILCEITGKTDLIYSLVLNTSAVKNGELWRLITSGFFHVDIFHLACNMYSLYIIGAQLENYIGKTKFIFVYFISLIVGSLLSCALFNGSSIGASGAIFGLLGSLIYFGYHYRVYFGSVLMTQLIPILAINIFISLMIANINIYAHIGGFAGGILATMAVGIKNKTQKSENVNGIICLTLTIIFLSFIIFK